MSVIYRITYPNGKIYIGQDRTDSLAYFGSPDSRLIEKDFTDEEKKVFTVIKEILWESSTATKEETYQKEVEYILSLKSNDPSIGYNRFPKHKG
jgi:hypothetical protein